MHTLSKSLFTHRGVCNLKILCLILTSIYIWLSLLLASIFHSTKWEEVWKVTEKKCTFKNWRRKKTKQKKNSLKPQLRCAGIWTVEKQPSTNKTKKKSKVKSIRDYLGAKAEFPLESSSLSPLLWDLWSHTGVDRNPSKPSDPRRPSRRRSRLSSSVRRKTLTLRKASERHTHGQDHLYRY